jgi:hypothetical protein
MAGAMREHHICIDDTREFAKCPSFSVQRTCQLRSSMEAISRGSSPADQEQLVGAFRGLAEPFLRVLNDIWHGVGIK